MTCIYQIGSNLWRPFLDLFFFFAFCTTVFNNEVIFEAQKVELSVFLFSCVLLAVIFFFPCGEQCYFQEVFISYVFFDDQDTSLSVLQHLFHLSSYCIFYFVFEKYENNYFIGPEHNWASRINNDMDCTFLTHCFLLCWHGTSVINSCIASRT